MSKQCVLLLYLKYTELTNGTEKVQEYIQMQLSEVDETDHNRCGLEGVRTKKRQRARQRYWSELLACIRVTEIVMEYNERTLRLSSVVQMLDSGFTATSISACRF